MFGQSEHVKEDLLEIILKIGGKTSDDFTDVNIGELNLIEDMGFDSVMIVDLLISLEEKYGIDLTDLSDLLEHLESVNQFTEFIEEKMNE